MAKKAFEKKEALLFENNTLRQLDLQKHLAEYWQREADMNRLKFQVTFVFVILEALVIWILAYYL